MKTQEQSYQSPFSWRYGSAEMRAIWSEWQKHLLWRKLWLILAETEAEFGLVGQAQVQDLRKNLEQIDLQRIAQIEAEVHHDLMAALKAYAEQCPLGGAILHLGATSMDIKDNAEALRVYESLFLVRRRLEELLEAFCLQIEKYAEVPVMAFTHLQPAEPTTLGYRLAQYAQDLWLDWKELAKRITEFRIKGFRGAVGTSAAYIELIGEEEVERFQQRLAERVGLPVYEVVTQVYPRKQDFRIASTLAGLGASLHRFALDLRFMQSAVIGEWMEPFGEKQVGSSAMPFKRNPIQAEKINALARQLAQLPRLAWDHSAHSILENTLDDSASRRTLLPEMFLITDELLRTALRLVKNLVFQEENIQRNFERFAPFAATERILTAATQAGASRQEVHEVLRRLSMRAWESIRQKGSNPLIGLILEEPILLRYLSREQLRELMSVSRYLGDASLRSKRLVTAIRTDLEKGKVDIDKRTAFDVHLVI
ncbi:MAG: adenylosuccinate lyase [Anaerolineales bacterium]|nr:adenylosuccinate lyase [Anaerolineales bacterium]MCS7246905.1 adenylosuccinate lyase [Anaerolineales bacterium]MDW8160716.1 adenylosuccinate lyase [Anaerolineales bacterium]MDW8445968.1 adenylosuccinate lyase [Anaerolineales bacterium]